MNFLAEFWSGVTRPAALSVTICGAACLLSLAALWLGARDLVASHYGYLAEHERDTDAFVTGQALDFARRPPPERTLVVLGASAIRHGIVDDAEFASLVSDAAGYRVTLHLALSNAQSLWESAALVDHLPRELAGLVLIEVNPLRISRGRQSLREIVARPRLGLVSQSVDRYAREIGLETPLRVGSYPWDNWQFLAARLHNVPRNLFRGPVRRNLRPQETARPPTQASLERTAVRLSTLLEGYHLELPSTLGVLEDAVTMARERGLRVGLLESPVNPRFIDEVAGPDLYRHFRSQMAALARRLNVAFVRPSLADTFAPAQFQDWFHLRDPGAIQGFSNELAQVSARLMSGTPLAGHPR